MSLPALITVHLPSLSLFYTLPSFIISILSLLILCQEEFTPVKWFSIDRVFRNETLDATHLAEFHQIEGVVADYNLTLGDLMGMLYEFFKKLGEPLYTMTCETFESSSTGLKVVTANRDTVNFCYSSKSEHLSNPVSCSQES